MKTEFQRFIADSLASTGWSNDVPLLESQEDWFVFTYGGKRGKSSAYFTHESSETDFVSIAWTKSPIYSILNIYDKSEKHQLASLQGTDRILGEVWRVPTEKLLSLDSDERNLLITKRIKIPVCISKGRVIDAWIYTVHPHYLFKGGISITKYTGYTWYGTDTKFLELT